MDGYGRSGVTKGPVLLNDTANCKHFSVSENVKKLLESSITALGHQCLYQAVSYCLIGPALSQAILRSYSEENREIVEDVHDCVDNENK